MDTELNDLLNKIDELNAKITPYRPLNIEQEKRLLQKLRLDWNYHSCNIEGNMLTYGETKDLLFWGITAKGKPFKDHIELKGHNEAVEWIYDIVKDKNRPLNETFIRELHSLIIAPDSYSDAKTVDGTLIKKKILAGEYKKMSNHVLTHTGEMFYFASPEETPAKMGDLIEWFRKTYDENKTHPLILAALFHYKFVRIHPFDDGNGRMSRILMNFILMMYGLPPVIVPTNDKSNYIQALELSDIENVDKFIIYIGERLLNSLELVLKAAQGESIEEPDDIDKEIALLEHKLKGIGKKSEIVKSKDAIISILDDSIKRLWMKLFEKCKKFDKYYVRKSFGVSDGYLRLDSDTGILPVKTGFHNVSENTKTIKLIYKYEDFNSNASKSYNYRLEVVFEFDSLSYKIYSDDIMLDRKIIKEKPYDEQLTDAEIDKIVHEVVRQHIKHIESATTKITNLEE